MISVDKELVKHRRELFNLLVYIALCGDVHAVVLFIDVLHELDVGLYSYRIEETAQVDDLL